LPRATTLFLIALLAASCSRLGGGTIKLDSNPPLSGGLGWAVVKDAYVRLKDAPSESAKDLDHLRKGLVLSLEARQLGLPDESTGKATFWFQIQTEGADGWVRGEELDVYASRGQAEKAAQAYR
jgi:hypothetical protein